MTIDDLELVPELAATSDVAEEGLMPCWVTFTCWLQASIFTTGW
jgi:hypothetical protein